MPRTRTSIAAGLAALVCLPAMSAIGADPPPSATPHPPAALSGTALVWCGDVETPRAAPDRYGDRPVYVGNEMPVEKVRRWARARPGFVDVWIDRENNGWINVMFTRDVARRQAELDRDFPGVGVVAVQVEHSTRELRRLARRVGAFVEARDIGAAYGWGNADNIVRLDLPVVSDELARALDEAFAGEPLCVSGPDPRDLPGPGPQPMRGDGWVMLGWEQGHGPEYEVGIATDAASYERLWEETGLDGPAPDVDFETNVVVWFSEGHGSSCPNLRLDEIIVDRERSQVYPLIVNLDEAVACTSDLAGVYQFVAALERTELPAGPFEIGLGGGGDGELWRSLWVDADLTPRGAVAGPEDIGSQPRYARSGTVQEPFGSFRYAMDAGCGIGYLGVINDVHWVTPEATDVPDAWADGLEADGELVVTVRLRTEPRPRVMVSGGGYTVHYEPAVEAPPPCYRPLRRHRGPRAERPCLAGCACRAQPAAVSRGAGA